MRKLFLSLAALCATIGISLAAPVTLVKFDETKKEVTVKDKDGAETTYTVDDKTTFKMGDTEYDASKAMKRLADPKAAGKAKFEVDANDKKVIKEIKFPAKKVKTTN